MPFVPHTPDDIAQMLTQIGANAISDLFKEIPPQLVVDSLNLPDGMNEMQATRLLQERAKSLSLDKCFIGAGAYEHHIPQAVWDITMRGEFLTAYTPYQAEASQGTLQLLWEYQTMMASLMGLEISNASLYDGASALAEAVLMACRLQKKAKEHLVYLPLTLNPFYRQVLKTILSIRHITAIEVPFDQNGKTSIDVLKSMQLHDGAILVLSQPNFFGVLEDVNALCDFAKRQGAMVIGVANPIASSLLKPPGQWGEMGADIACGEGQPLGIPLASGGPYLGFLCTTKENARQLPGRVVGRTTDSDGKQGFTLTLQAREQHIRREKATSNICTNQGLLVTAATIYMSLLGARGLKAVAMRCYERNQFLMKQLSKIDLKPLFTADYFHEIPILLPVDVYKVLEMMAKKGFAAGFPIESHYPTLKNVLLVCVTETKTDEDIMDYVTALKESIEQIKNKESNSRISTW